MNTVPNIRICEHCGTENPEFQIPCWKCGLWKDETYHHLPPAITLTSGNIERWEMTPDELGVADASAVNAVLSIKNPTLDLRWNDGVLEQKWEIRAFRPYPSMTFEWLPVETVVKERKG